MEDERTADRGGSGVSRGAIDRLTTHDRRLARRDALIAAQEAKTADVDRVIRRQNNVRSNWISLTDDAEGSAEHDSLQLFTRNGLSWFFDDSERTKMSVRVKSGEAVDRRGD